MEFTCTLSKKKTCSKYVWLALCSRFLRISFLFHYLTTRRHEQGQEALQDNVGLFVLSTQIVIRMYSVAFLGKSSGRRTYLLHVHIAFLETIQTYLNISYLMSGPMNIDSSHLQGKGLKTCNGWSNRGTFCTHLPNDHQTYMLWLELDFHVYT